MGIGFLDANAAEALGAYLSVCLCRELRFSHICRERDAKSVVDAVTTGKPSSQAFGHLIDDIRVSLAYIPQWRI
jgi:hypothetical protein